MARLFRPPRVRSSALWCVGAVSSLYLGCAAYEVHHDAALVRQLEEERRRRLTTFLARSLTETAAATATDTPTLRQVDGVRALLAQHGRRAAQQREQLPILDAFARPWATLPEPDKVLAAMVGTNVGVHALDALLPSVGFLFTHTPATGRHYTLLTSTFGHAGLLHLAVNMTALVQFWPPVAASPTFAASGSHLTAFYLGAGILAGYGYELSARATRGLGSARGASGAIMALLGVYGMTYPERRLGLLFLPWSFSAPEFLVALAAFDGYGMVFGYRWLPRLAHAAHLSGLAVGVAYVQCDGRRWLWEPARRAAYGVMDRLHVL